MRRRTGQPGLDPRHRMAGELKNKPGVVNVMRKFRAEHTDKKYAELLERRDQNAAKLREARAHTLSRAAR